MWNMICTTEGCDAKGVVYPTDAEEIRCGSCLVTYTKND
jgi:hypothetical protein